MKAFQKVYDQRSVVTVQSPSEVLICYLLYYASLRVLYKSSHRWQTTSTYALPEFGLPGVDLTYPWSAPSWSTRQDFPYTSKLGSNLNSKRMLDPLWCFYPALLRIAKRLRGSVAPPSLYLLSVKQGYLSPGDTMGRCGLKVAWAGTKLTSLGKSNSHISVLYLYKNSMKKQTLLVNSKSSSYHML